MTGGRSLPVIPSETPAGEPPAFDRIAVVGLLGLGAAVATAARAAWPRALVIGVDRNDRLEQAIRAAAVDVGADDPIVIAEADLVVLAVSRTEQERWLAALPDLVPGPAVVTTARADEGMPDGAAALPDRFTFIGGHSCVAEGPPGLAGARADRFAGSRWLLAARAGVQPADRLAAFVRAIGATPEFVPGGAAGFPSIRRPA